MQILRDLTLHLADNPPVSTGETGPRQPICLPLLALFSIAFAFPVHAQSEAQIRRAAEKALIPIKLSVDTYVQKRACFSCHHNGLAIPVLREAFVRGLETYPTQGTLERKTYRSVPIALTMTGSIEAADLSDPTPNDSLLLAPTPDTGFRLSEPVRVQANRLMRWQHPDGHWATSDFRPPHSSSIFTATYSAVAAIKVSWPEPPVATFDRARKWFLTNKPNSTEDAVFKLLGLLETGAAPSEKRAAADDMIARQLPNGGWPQLPGYPADAYSTGEAIFALSQAEAMQDARRAGIRFLLSTQAADGTWHVHTRMLSPAHVSPPYFTTGFPYGRDEFISFTGSAWALRALVTELPVHRRVNSIVDSAKPEPVDLLRKAALFGTEADLRRELDEKGWNANYDMGDGVTLLMMAAPDESKVRLLLSRGADARTRSKSGTDALTIAAGYRDNIGVLTALLNAGAEPNLPADSKLPNSPLVAASMTGDLAMVKLLLARGADPNSSSRSNTPISAAATFGHADVVQALIDAGASVDLAESTGINLLHWAAITNRPQLVPILKKAGVPINAMDDNGFTPLHYAASIDFGETKMVEALLAAGANRKLRDFDERTPLQQALRLHHQALAKSLAEPRASASGAPQQGTKPASSKPVAATR